MFTEAGEDVEATPLAYNVLETTMPARVKTVVALLGK